MNFLDSDDDTSRVRKAYGRRHVPDDTYRRLAEVKANTTRERVPQQQEHSAWDAGAVSDRQVGTTSNWYAVARGSRQPGTWVVPVLARMRV